MKSIKSGMCLLDDIVGRKFNLHAILYPVQFSLILTKHCNARCEMCNIWKLKTRDDLTVNELKKLGKSKNLRNVMFLGISGGEPFIRKDLVEAVLALSKNMKLLKEIRFSTNGSITEKIVADIVILLKKVKCRIDVTISLDGIGKAHNEVRGFPGLYKKVMQTIDSLREIQKREKRLDIGIRFTMLPSNYKELMTLYRLSKRKDVGFTFKPVDVGGLFDNNESKQEYTFTKNQQREILNAIREIIKTEKEELKKLNGFSAVKKTANILFLKYMMKYVKDPATPITSCYACFTSVFMEHNGDIHSCPILYRKVSSIRKESFDKIWQGKEMKDIRSFIKQEKCSCYTNCNLLPSIVLSGIPRIMYMITKAKLGKN